MLTSARNSPGDSRNPCSVALRFCICCLSLLIFSLIRLVFASAKSDLARSAVFIAQRYRAMLSSICCRRALTFALVKSRSRLLTALNLLPSMAKKYVQAVGFKTDGGAWAGVAPSAG
jgi:hypothetical protein